MIGLGIHRAAGSPYDSASREFFDRAGVIDPMVKRRHDRVVRHLKSSFASDGKTLWEHLWLWYGADAGVFHDIGGGVLVPAANGETVRLWLNRKGDYFPAYQTTDENQPLYLSSGGAINLPAISADGVNDGLYIDNDVRLRPGLTLCAFGKDMGNTGVGNCYIWGFGDSSISSPADLLIVSTLTPGNARLFTYNGSTTPTTILIPNANVGSKLISHVYNGAASAAYATGVTDTTGALSTSNSGIGPGLMLFRSGNGNPGKGLYTHIMYFRTALAKAQHTALETLMFSL